MSPRSTMPSPRVRPAPPTRARRSAFFTSSWPKISGAREEASLSYTSAAEEAASTAAVNAASSAASPYDGLSWVTAVTSRKVEASRGERPPLPPCGPAAAPDASGRKMPATVTASPGFTQRVISPRRWSVMERGVEPVGT